MKKCPYCDGEIQEDALQCRYCGKPISPLLAPEPGSNGANSTRVAVVVLLLVFLAAGVFLFRLTQSSAASVPTPTPGPTVPVVFVTLSCGGECEKISLWKAPNDVHLSGQVPSLCTARQLDTSYSGGMTWYLVETGGVRGWVVEDFVK